MTFRKKFSTSFYILHRRRDAASRLHRERLPALIASLPTTPLDRCTELLLTLLLDNRASPKSPAAPKDKTNPRRSLVTALCQQFDDSGSAAPLVLLPHLYPDPRAASAVRSSSMAGKAGSLLEGALPDLVLEMGYHFTSSVEECRASLLQLGGREVYAATVAKVCVRYRYLQLVVPKYRTCIIPRTVPRLLIEIYLSNYATFRPI